MFCFTRSNILINIYFLIFINKFVRYKRTNILFILILVNIYFLSFFYLFIVNNFSKASGGSLGSLVVTTFHEGVGNLVELGNVWLDLAVVQKWLRCLDMALAGVSWSLEGLGMSPLRTVGPPCLIATWITT